jgi:DNA-binding transcriptional MocR family regulator
MDAVEKLVAQDASIKAIWLVPKYSNPTGTTLSDSVVQRLASMPTKAFDFRLMWDNAYAVHHLGSGPAKLANVLELCERAGNPHRPFIFGSTSKVTFAGAGLAAMGGSALNMDWMRKHRSMMTIGPDKVNQLRHVRLLGDRQGLYEHMHKHATILAPKFGKVQEVLGKRLGSSGLAQWTKPTGGYFVSLDTLDGCAKRVVALANAVGVKLTAAGATFPLGKDPRDRNIRIAPSLPSVTEIEQAMEVLCCCVKLASLEK